MIREMLGGLGIAEAGLLVARKGDLRKRVIAQRLRQQTSVSLRWLAGPPENGERGSCEPPGKFAERFAKSPGPARL